MSFPKPLLSVLAAMWPVAACGTAAAQPDDSPKALRAKVIQAADSDSKADAYKALLLKVGKAGVADLMKDEDTGIALQAAWEAHKKSARRPKHLEHRSDDIYDPGELAKFLAFVRDRTKAPVPDWWAANIADVDLAPGQAHGFLSLTDSKPGPKLRKSRVGSLVPEGAELERRGGALVYSAGGRSVEIPADTFGMSPDDYFVGLAGDKWSAIAPYGVGGFPFRLAGFVGKGGKAAWTADVWAAGRTGLAGEGWHVVELKGSRDAVYVFGEEGCGMYLEAFDAATGKCLYRFCTCYWFHFPETWGLK
jgi:hypothetical protein